MTAIRVIKSSDFDPNVKKYLRALPNREVQKLLDHTSKPFEEAGIAMAPQHDGPPVKRYIKGKVVARYHSGNLGRSTKKLTFRNSSRFRGLFKGPKAIIIGNPHGEFANRSRTDGYYAHMVLHKGGGNRQNTEWLDRAWNSTVDQIIINIAAEVRKRLFGIGA